MLTDKAGPRWERIQAAALADLADDEVTLIDFAGSLQQDVTTYKVMITILLAQLARRPSP